MRNRRITIIVFATLVLLIFRATRPRHTAPHTASPAVAISQPSPPVPPPAVEIAPAATVGETAAETPVAEPPPAETPRDPSDPLVPSTIPGVTPRIAPPNTPELAATLDKISLMFRDYRTVNGENPVGTNAEIMKALMGGNPRGATFGPPEGQLLNDQGELIDPWGTPYFFHQLDKDLMEIHSAGPDRTLGTSDDAVTK